MANAEDCDPDARAYFLIDEDGPEKQAAINWLKEANAAYRKRKKFEKEIGACGLVNLGANVVAAIFKKAPEGKAWRLFRDYLPEKEGEVAYAPARGYSQGKTLAKRFAELTAPDAQSFNRAIGAGMYVGVMDRGMCILRCSFEQLGEHFVLTVPASKTGAPRFTPKGPHKLLKKSEYHKLVEDHEEKTKKRKKAS